eukprot:363330-Chlamydomonas_euryale.AAC.26
MADLTDLISPPGDLFAHQEPQNTRHPHISTAPKQSIFCGMLQLLIGVKLSSRAGKESVKVHATA